MSANFALRRRVYGAATLGEANLAMISVAEAAGLPVKFPGSGGAVVGMASSEEASTGLSTPRVPQAQGSKCTV